MRLRPFALPAVAALTLLAVPFGAPANAAAAAALECNGRLCSASFDFTGAPESFTVPTGVTSIFVTAYGAAGGSGHTRQAVQAAGDAGHARADARPAAAGATDGGAGGGVFAAVPVTPGETLTVVVGGRGGDATDGDDTARGGYGGGGDSPTLGDGSDGGGGGGSFLFRGSVLLLAAGGGGGGGFVADGNGGAGGPGASSSTAGADGGDVTLGGHGGTGTAPGTAGGGFNGNPGTGPAAGPASFGAGGVATAASDTGTCSAGGGGGGYYGGGSGGCTRTGTYADGGGGGGSGFVGGGAVLFGTGQTTGGDGGVVFGYQGPPVPVATATSLGSDTLTLAPGQHAELTASVTGPPVVAQLPTGSGTSGVATAMATSFAHRVGAVRTVHPAAAGSPVTPPAGYQLDPGTACGYPPPPLPSGVKPTACTVTFFVNGTPLGAPVEVDASTGVATSEFTAGSELGVRRITARYDANTYYRSSTSNTISITVSGLADTGPGHLAPMLTTAAALLVAGAVLLGFGRRRPGTHGAS